MAGSGFGQILRRDAGFGILGDPPHWGGGIQEFNNLISVGNWGGGVGGGFKNLISVWGEGAFI